MTNDKRSLLIAALLLCALPAAAQWIECLPTNQPLPRIPELIPKEGENKLRATILVVDEDQRMTYRDPATNQQGSTLSTTRCAPQHVRAFKGVGAVPAAPTPASGVPPDPMPGPTIRARVGDIVELTFLNHVNPANFIDSLDRGDLLVPGCDEVNIGYPGGDKWPNCFHGSSTANLHFHGTHTNPSSTGDNVFIELRPSPRKDGQPVITEAVVKDWFDGFFKQCEANLGQNALYEWPQTWNDMPAAWTGCGGDLPLNCDSTNDPPENSQKALILAYDKKPGIVKLWPFNKTSLGKGHWPEYYIGSYPYCFRLPAYTGTKFPPDAVAPTLHTPQSHGAGTAEQEATGPAGPILMGQAPGTHWYHAHKHGSTAINLLNGMSGAFIIEGDYDDQLDKFYDEKGWTRRQPVMVINQLGDLPNLEHGGAQRVSRGPDLSVNGRLNPKVRMRPGEVQLWRIVNSSSRAGVYFLEPDPSRSPRVTWKQLAQDGVQFNVTNYRNGNRQGQPFLLASGNRADLLVKAPDGFGDYPVIVQNVIDPSQLANSNEVTLLTVEVTNVDRHTAPPLHTNLLPPLTAGQKDNTFPLTFPPFLQDIEKFDGTKKIVFATRPQNKPPGAFAIHTIDGKQFNGDVGEVVLLNQVEEWKVYNATGNISHPFHIHINPFQVTEIFNPKVTLPGIKGTGTIAIAFPASSTLKGTGTKFTTELFVGYQIQIVNSDSTITTVGTIKSITDDTTLTLTATAQGRGNTFPPFTYVAPKYVTDPDALKNPGQCFIDPNQPENDPVDPAYCVQKNPDNPNGPLINGPWVPPPPTPTPRIWWDVFPIPSGLGATKLNGDKIFKPCVDEKGKVIECPAADKDIQIVMPGYFKMRSRFVDYPGYFVIHCHILAHEDRGMMTVVQVAPLTLPFTHR